MIGSSGTLRARVELPVEPSAAFDGLVEELVRALAGRGIRFEPRAAGRVLQNESVIAEVAVWTPGERIVLRWCQSGWNPDEATEIELRCEPAEDQGTHVSFEHRGWDRAIGDPGELVGWFAAAMIVPFLHAATPAAFGDWIADRGAKRPSGARARAIYRDPLFHYPNFRVILTELSLTPDDHLLEVGCGGGALLKSALQSGCRAVAIDHSSDMIRLAREVNGGAVADRRLRLLQAEASALPFRDATFTCAAMTGVLGFLPDPIGALGEIRRVLAGRGRLVVLGSDPELKGTPAAPEPFASRLRFYDDGQLEELGRVAGFAKVRVVRRDLEPFAREVGIPEELLPMFAGPGARFLLAQKD